MKLLLDENLSSRTAVRIGDLFPGSTSVEALGMRGCSDGDLFEHAAKHGFAPVSKDGDFKQLSLVLGLPPKVIWLAVGNALPREIEALLRLQASSMQAFFEHPVESLLVLELRREG